MSTDDKHSGPLGSDDDIRRRHREALERGWWAWLPPDPNDRQEVLDWFEDWTAELRLQAAQGHELWLQIPNVELLNTLSAMVRDGCILGEGRRRRRTSHAQRQSIHRAAWWGLMYEDQLKANGTPTPAVQAHVRNKYGVELPLPALDARCIAGMEAAKHLYEEYGVQLEASTMERKIAVVAAIRAAMRHEGLLNGSPA